MTKKFTVLRLQKRLQRRDGSVRMMNLSEDSHALMKNATNIDSCYESAFELVFALQDAPEASKGEIKAQILSFVAQSETHRHAIERAEAEWILMGQLQVDELLPVSRARFSVPRSIAGVFNHPRRSNTLVAIFVLAVLLPILWPVLVENPMTDTTGLFVPLSEYKTAFGEQLEVNLEDGSVIKLNWDTELVVSYSENTRSITLKRGEAMFSVAKDVVRPFVVGANRISAKALGTEFVVRKFDADKVDVAVAEGTVAVSLQPRMQGERIVSSEVVLNQAQSLTSTYQGFSPIRHLLPGEIAPWRQGMVVFDQQPITKVLREMNRYTPYELVVVNLKNPQEAVTATYFIDNIEEGLSTLVTLFDLQTQKVKVAGQETLILSSSR